MATYFHYLMRSYKSRWTTKWKWIICTILFIIILSAIYVVIKNKEFFSVFDENRINCYVITMRNQDRIKNIEENQSKLNFNINIVDAINGNKIDINNIKDPTIDKQYIIDSNKIRKSEIGCYLSHYNLYKKIETEKDKYDYTIIFEDDFLIESNDFEQQVLNTLQNMRSHDFDILYLYNTSDNMGDSFIENVCEIDKSKQLWGTMAYIVKNVNIHRIITETKYVDSPIDYQIWKSHQNDKLKIYTFCPFIAKTNDSPSTIQVYD